MQQEEQAVMPEQVQHTNAGIEMIEYPTGSISIGPLNVSYGNPFIDVTVILSILIVGYVVKKAVGRYIEKRKESKSDHHCEHDDK